MEAVHVELVRLATELEAVKGHVQTVRRTTRPLCTGHYSHVKVRFTARRGGQGGALLREVAMLEKFEDDTIETLARTFWDVQQLSAAMAAALIKCTRGEV